MKVMNDETSQPQNKSWHRAELHGTAFSLPVCTIISEAWEFTSYFSAQWHIFIWWIIHIKHFSLAQCYLPFYTESSAIKIKAKQH